MTLDRHFGPLTFLHILCVFVFLFFFILFVSLQMPPQWAQQIIFFDSIALKWYNSNFLHLSYCHYNSKIYILRWFGNQSIQMSNHWIKSNLTGCWIDTFKQCKTNTRETFSYMLHYYFFLSACWLSHDNTQFLSNSKIKGALLWLLTKCIPIKLKCKLT